MYLMLLQWCLSLCCILMETKRTVLPIRFRGFIKRNTKEHFHGSFCVLSLSMQQLTNDQSSAYHSTLNVCLSEIQSIHGTMGKLNARSLQPLAQELRGPRHGHQPKRRHSFQENKKSAKVSTLYKGSEIQEVC